MHRQAHPKLRGTPGVRCSSATRCSQGFGSSGSPKNSRVNVKGKKEKKEKKSVEITFESGSPKAVKRAVQLAEGRSSRPVDTQEAAQGRVDFVKVKDWGGGDNRDLGELQVKNTSHINYDASAPLYEQLAKHLEVLQAQGALAVAQVRDAKPLPPFKEWAFEESHYLQYLSDILSVHSAMEQALVDVLSADAYKEPLPESLKSALALVGPSNGLFRSQELEHDLQQLLSSSDASTQEAQCSSVLHEANRRWPYPAPSPNAAGLAQLLSNLGRRVTVAESRGECRAAAIKLLSHAYVIMLVFLTSGVRIGAAGAEKLDLFSRGALNTYRTYPEHVGNPVEKFKAIIDSWGDLLDEQDREALMQELPGAMQKASLLLTPLAQR